ncbi:MAG: hypothetical protein ACJAYG_000143 [Oceanicoccus sp.]|jgi:hypothetical protein
MTTWNYRVIKKSGDKTRDVTYQVHEVYYLKDDSIDCWNHTPVEPLGVSEPGLRNDIHSFLSAFRQPVLTERYVNGKAMLVAERPTRPARDLTTDYAGKANRASDYINQILGNHLLLKQDPSLRKAYEKVEQALTDLQDMVGGQQYPMAESA